MFQRVRRAWIAVAIADGPLWPLLWAVVVAVNTTLLYVGPFAR